jgi:hypothetical protein
MNYILYDRLRTYFGNKDLYAGANKIVMAYYNDDIVRGVEEDVYAGEYLTFDIISGGTLGLKTTSSSGAYATAETWTFSCEYSINDGQWTTMTIGNTTWQGVNINVSNGDKIKFKANCNGWRVRPNFSVKFYGTSTYDISGNIMSLVYGDNFEGRTDLPLNIVDGNNLPRFCRDTFRMLFSGCNVVHAHKLKLPATNLDKSYSAGGVYSYMFSGCRLLVSAPELPSPNLGYGCYDEMFNLCVSLEKAPDLNAYTLAEYCYAFMFYECSNLKHIKCLARYNIGANNALKAWVSGTYSNGTFIKSRYNNSWETGNSGIPEGWTVESE